MIYTLYIITVHYKNGDVVHFRFNNPRYARQFDEEAKLHPEVIKTVYSSHDLMNIYTDMWTAFHDLNEFAKPRDTDDDRLFA